MCNEQEADRETEGNKPKNLFAAYDLLLRQFHANGDHYFRRTQILMIVAQSGLFLAYGKLFQSGTGRNALPEGNLLLLILPLVGIAASYIWKEMLERQYGYMELCRYYMRHIEHKLIATGVSFDYFTKESDVFAEHKRKIICLSGSDGRGFPYKDMQAKGGLMKVEGWLIWLLIAVWISLLFARAFPKMKELMPACPAIFWILSFILLLVAALLFVWLVFSLLPKFRPMRRVFQYCEIVG